MSAYSDTQINKAILSGQIVCYPGIPENVRGSSIDLTLGEHYYECDRNSLPGIIYNPFDPDEVERYFSLKRAEPHSGDLKGIPDDHPIVWVPGKGRILAHTHEFVGIRAPGTSALHARSTWGRNGIAVALCAGRGDPGYINRWTLEVHNFNDQWVPLPVGERIAQIVFYETGSVERDYAGGKYQGDVDLHDLVQSWRPEMMLPRAFEDERRLPIKVITDLVP